MLTVLKKLGDRLKEPGSIRSLALVIFACKGLLPVSWQSQIVSADVVQTFLTALIVLLGGVSFLTPELAKVVVVSPENAPTVAISQVEAVAAKAVSVAAPAAAVEVAQAVENVVANIEQPRT
jgi:hypothetical protein